MLRHRSTISHTKGVDTIHIYDLSKRQAVSSPVPIMSRNEDIVVKVHWFVYMGKAAFCYGTVLGHLVVCTYDQEKDKVSQCNSVQTCILTTMPVY